MCDILTREKYREKDKEWIAHICSECVWDFFFRWGDTNIFEILDFYFVWFQFWIKDNIVFLIDFFNTQFDKNSDLKFYVDYGFLYFFLLNFLFRYWGQNLLKECLKHQNQYKKLALEHTNINRFKYVYQQNSFKKHCCQFIQYFNWLNFIKLQPVCPSYSQIYILHWINAQ